MGLLMTGGGREDSVFVRNNATGAASVSFSSMVANNPYNVMWTIGGVANATLNPGVVALPGADKSVIFEFTPVQRLTGFSLRNNALTGTFPDLAGCTSLSAIDCAINALTGSLPSFDSLVSLTSVNIRTNALSGDIPSLGRNTALTQIFGYTNQFTGIVSGFAVPPSLGDFEFNLCALTQAAVDAILAAFVAAGRTSANGACVLRIDGLGNAAPSAAGAASKATLAARGWTVITN